MAQESGRVLLAQGFYDTEVKLTGATAGVGQDGNRITIKLALMVDDQFDCLTMGFSIKLFILLHVWYVLYMVTGTHVCTEG